jgi:predicted nucleic acid-binding protein
MVNVIIDTSAWIQTFRPQCDKSLADAVKELIRNDRVLMPGLIKAELLRGTRTEAEFEHLKDLLESLIYLPVNESFWDDLAAFSFNLFRKGLTVTLVDTAIALLSIQSKAPLLQCDRHFEMIAEVTELKLL